MKKDLEFEAFFKANEGRIHFQIRRLGISEDLYGEFYSEGIFALWRAYKRYNPAKGEIGTFANYQIRYRLIDLIRKKVRDQEVVTEAEHEEKLQLDNGNRHRATGLPVLNTGGIVLENEAFWTEVKKGLTLNQWKWVHYFIIADLTVKEIMEIEAVSEDAVKGWAREVRRKLHVESIHKKLEKLL